jgi:histidinol-phosphate aminotransferase
VAGARCEEAKEADLMSRNPQATAQLRAVPTSTPFVGPEDLARRVGRHTLVRLGANESSFGPSPLAIEAMHAAVPETSFYGDPELVDLRTALAARHGCGLEHLSVGAGIDDLLGLIVRAYCGEGGTALMTRGSYPTFVYHVVAYGAVLATVEPLADGSTDISALAVAARKLRPRVVYLANPDNPSGSFVGREAVETLRAAVPDDALLVLDEAYADFVEPQELLPEAIDSGTIRLRTFSKAYGMAGSRIAYAIAPPEVVATFQKIRHHFGVNRIAQAGALAALADGGFVSGVVAEVARGREEYHALGRRLGLRTLPSRTNFVCFEIGTRAQAEAMVDAMLRHGIFIRKPGQPPIDGFIRVTVGTAEQRALFAGCLAEALDAVRERVS